jgi:hypothetical protein
MADWKPQKNRTIMKKCTPIVRLLIIAALMFSSLYVYAGRTQVMIEHYTEGKGAPTIRTNVV